MAIFLYCMKIFHRPWTVYTQQPFEDLAHSAWFAQIRNMSRGAFLWKIGIFMVFPTLESVEK
jgi:hypothetical protein